MNKPEFFQSKPVVVRAIQFTGDNHSAINEFVAKHNGKVITEEVFGSVHNYLWVDQTNWWLSSGVWVIEFADGITVRSDEIFKRDYMQKTEGL